MKEGEKFSGSEDFAKSLEPKYADESVEHEHSAHKKHPAHKKHSHSAHDDEHDSALEQKEHHHHPKKVKDEHHPHRRKNFEVFFAIYLLILLVIIFAVAVSAQANPFIVLIAMLPTMFTMFAAMFIYEAKPDNKNILWPVPVIVVLIFYFLAKEFAGGILSGLDVDTMSGVNMFLAYLYVIINYFLMNKAPSKTKVKTKVIVKEAPPEDISEFIASIEDKSKALNFVIGRVYNAYHGGTRTLREKINMKQDWYDQFSKVPSDPEQIDFKALKKLLASIELRLGKLEKSEKEVFGTAHLDFKNLTRASDGSDKVIDVLDKNDKDPVRSYYDGALQFVQKIRDFMEHRQIPGVENEYVEKDDEKTAAPRSSTWHKDSEITKKD